MTRTNRHAPQPRLSPPMEIQRPRSALHTGDFTKDWGNLGNSIRGLPGRPGYSQSGSVNGALGTSPTTPWYTPSSSLDGFRAGERTCDTSGRRPSRSRAPSLSSYSSSYILKAPTTPLVQQSNNTDLDFSPRDRSASPSKSNRRHTMPPQALQALQSPPSGYLSSPSHVTRQTPIRRDSTFPYHTHPPRRSLASNWSLQASTSPQVSGSLRPRRLSHSSEISPLQNASMVGSYEESILRGWMSTAPSKPLDFTAQIGVLGKGDCKPKCPAHVTIPFPAVFYSWSGGSSKRIADDEPSPYVGHIDLQHSLPPPKPNARERKHGVTIDFNAEYDLANPSSDHEEGDVANISIRKRKKHRQTSPGPLAPPDGCYRIPQQGQLQIIIKNPNKTAVKLFLVPYDLEGMEAGTKTFIRQRCYSTDPIADSSVASGPLSNTSASPMAGHGFQKKPSLRYLIHLNICSPSKGRFYLYQHIRVVFANRVPDNKEQLQNEIQVPQPRYSTYKAQRDSISGPSSTAGFKLTAEKAYRRRSSGFSLEALDGRYSQPFASGTNFSSTAGSVAPPVPTIPFNLAMAKQRPTAENLEIEDDAMDLDTSRSITSSDMQSPLSDKASRFYNGVTGSFRSHSTHSSDSYGKLSKGDAGYGGVFGRPATPERGDGLLARKLKGLGVDRGGRHQDEL